MAVCSFLGHSEIYDLNLRPCIEMAIEKILAREQEVEFLFHCQGDFYNQCLVAVLGAKQRYPGRVRLTLLLETEKLKAAGCAGTMQAVKIVFDHIIPLSLAANTEKNLRSWKKAVRAFVLNATYAITYYYSDLRDEWATLYKAVKKEMQVIDLTREGTTVYIRDCIGKLPEEEAAVLEKINAGKSQTSIAKAAGITSPVVHKRDARGRKNLRLYAQRRVERELIGRGAAPAASCALLLFSPPANWAEFQAAVDFLIDKLGVSKFLVEQVNCFNDYANEIIKRSRMGNVQLTAYTHQPETEGDPWREDSYSAYSEVIPVPSEASTIWDRISEAELEMLLHAEYVIYDSERETGAVERLERQIAGFRQLKVFDIGHRPCFRDAVRI